MTTEANRSSQYYQSFINNTELSEV